MLVYQRVTSIYSGCSIATAPGGPRRSHHHDLPQEPIAVLEERLTRLERVVGWPGQVTGFKLG